MYKADVLIVGQGIAGTCLAFALLGRGLTVHIVDDNHASAASLVETAIINPVTGRRYAKSWEIDNLLPEADVSYGRIATTLGREYLSPVGIVQVLPDARVEEIWMLRSADPEFQPYLERHINETRWEGIPRFRSGVIDNARRLRISALIADAAGWFSQGGLLTRDTLDPEQIEHRADGVHYHGQHYRNVVFCQGNSISQNPLFKWLEIIPMKGEFLICRIPGLHLPAPLKSHVTLIPLSEEELFWCGSTYDRYNQDPAPTDRGRAYLLKQLSLLTGGRPVEVVRHGAGIRGTSSDRRPYIGAHGKFTNFLAIAGLGTKGASLAPYCARILADYLAEGSEIPGEVDILRHTAR